VPSHPNVDLGGLTSARIYQAFRETSSKRKWHDGLNLCLGGKLLALFDACSDGPTM